MAMEMVLVETQVIQVLNLSVKDVWFGMQPLLFVIRPCDPNSVCQHSLFMSLAYKFYLPLNY